MQLVMMFVAGMLFGASVMADLMLYWPTDGSPARHVRKSYPRKTSMPKLRTRVEGRPTNINEPPATIRQIQFRGKSRKPKE